METFITREFNTLANRTTQAATKRQDEQFAATEATLAMQRSAAAQAAAEDAERKRVEQLDYVIAELSDLRNDPAYVLGTGPRNDPSNDDLESVANTTPNAYRRAA